MSGMTIRHDDPESRVTVMGKEVLWDGAHMLDCVDQRTAEFVAIAIAALGLPHKALPADIQTKIEEFCA